VEQTFVVRGDAPLAEESQMSDIARAQQVAEVAELTQWLLSLSPEEYRPRVLNLAGWVEVLSLDEPSSDDLKGYVDRLSAED
jgi:hypothetical protein